MAPSRRSSKAATASGSGPKRSGAATSGLFFGGTELVQNNDENEDEYREESYLYDSDADEDDEFEDVTAGGRTRQAKQSNKKGGRASGRKAAAPKPIDSDYDSEDQRIIHYKKLGYKDDYVANKLVEEGHSRYSAKRISTRWLRLKKHVEQKEEQRLDDELSDWHIGEDEKLRDCFNASEAKYEVELLKLKERKWKEISTSLGEALREKKYTPKACKERWESLEDGTALLPIELDPNQDEREAMRQARVVENKRRRDEQKAAVVWALGEKDRKAAEKRAILEQKDRERQVERARKQAEKDEDDRIKAEQRAGLDARRAAQRAVEAEIKDYHESKRNERKNADAMYMHYTGKKLNGRRDNNLIKGGDDDETDYSDSDIEMADSFFDDDEKEPDMPDLTDAEEASAGGSEDDMEIEDTNAGKSTGTKSKAKGHTIKSKKPKVTLETLINPRSIMTDAELAEVLARRNLRRRARDETHPEVVARMAAADLSESVAQVKLLLAAYFERRKGSREVLVRRLQEYDAASSEAGLRGVTAIDPEFKSGYEGYRGKFSYALGE